MVALSTHVRLDENVIIDKPTYGDTDDDVYHIISYGHLTSSSAKPKRICYFGITLISATLCHAGRYIARHRNYIDMMEFPFDVTSIISDRHRPTTFANINEETQFRYRFNKGNAMLDQHIGRYQKI